MNWRSRKVLIAILAVVGLVAAAGIVVFVLSSGEEDTAAPPPTTTTTTTTPKPKPKPKPQVGQYPPALAVKIDNVAASRPHTGLGPANLIFVEPVEGGLTRMMAVYWGKRPRTIGPVRSARESDIGLLAQIKRPVLSYSGSASQLRRALFRSTIVLASPDYAGGAYSRNFSRPNPHNMFVAPNALPKTKPVKSPLLVGKAPAGGKRTTSESVYYQGASYGFQWDKKARVWRISMSGSPLVSTERGQLVAGTVIVQRVKIGTGIGIRDAAGNLSPVVKSTGKGAVTVLRDAKAYQGTWSRPKAERRTLYKTSNGKPLPMAPGQVWVMLVPG